MSRRGIDATRFMDRRLIDEHKFLAGSGNEIRDLAREKVVLRGISSALRICGKETS